MKKGNATDTYIGIIAEIADKLEAIKSYAVDDHMGVEADKVNWGNVGTAKALLALLNEAAEFSGI